jgi:hypothetical protein
VVDRSTSIVSFLADDERAAWIFATYPFDGHLPAYNSFAGESRGQNTIWHIFAGQGALHDGTFCYVVSTNHPAKLAVIKTQHDERTVPFAELSPIPPPELSKSAKWDGVVWKSRDEMRAEFGFVSAPPYRGNGSAIPEFREVA